MEGGGSEKRCQIRLFPLDSTGRFVGNVVDYPINFFDFVDDADRDAVKDRVGDGSPMDGHDIERLDDTEGDRFSIDSRVAFYSSGADAGKDGGGLPDRDFDSREFF